MHARAMLVWLVLSSGSVSAVEPETLRAFAEVYDVVKSRHVDPVGDDALVRHAIEGMLLRLDPSASFIDAEEFRQLRRSAPPLGGTGMELGMEDGHVKVISPIEGTPAAAGGIQTGDLLLAVDGEFLKGRTLSEAVRLLRGPPGTQVRLTLARRGESKPREVTLTRQVIRIQTVRSQLSSGDIAYVRISAFQEATPESLARQVADLFSRAEVRLLIIDLRSNPGGLLHAGIAAAALFLPDNATIVASDGRDKDMRRIYKAVPEHYLRGGEADPRKLVPARAREIPMAVLLDQGSAGSSEIFAAAMRDNRRATLFGQQTFGHGRIQTIIPLSNDTAIRLTTGRYYSPSGRSIQALGVRPDVEVVERLGRGQAGSESDPVFKAAVDRLGR
jgi:carboxyl-terminal processing protease